MTTRPIESQGLPEIWDREAGPKGAPTYVSIGLLPAVGWVPDTGDWGSG